MNTDPTISQHAQALSARGASKGGKARAKSLTAEARRHIAQRAAETRWGATVPKATHSGLLDLAGSQLACAVLANGTRLLTQRDFLTAIGHASPPAGTKRPATSLRAEDPPPFFGAENLRPFLSDDVFTMSNPIAFRTIEGARALGYDAKLLPHVCDAYLQAREAHQSSLLLEGKRLLTEDQERRAAACEGLMRGLAQGGIVALIDEATGYQADREKDERSRLLAASLPEDLRPWIKQFPDEFFKQISRLYRWQYRPGNTQSPWDIGKLITTWIYEQLPPGVLPARQENHPVPERGQRKETTSPLFTEPTGESHLDRQILVVTILMRISGTKEEFERNFQKAFGKPYQQELPLEEQRDRSLNKGLASSWG